MDLLLKIITIAPPLLVAVILHEIAHGYVALKLGDPTARNLKRLTLNPLRHIDPFMTVILPALLIVSGSPIVFGGAKPVPVDTRYFKNPRFGMALVAAAGPATNFVLMAIAFGVLELLKNFVPLVFIVPVVGQLLGAWLIYSIFINLILALFNLIPVPPLDGGRIAVGFLPIALARPLARLERYGLLIVVMILLSGVFDSVLRPVLVAVQQLIFEGESLL